MSSYNAGRRCGICRKQGHIRTNCPENKDKGQKSSGAVHPKSRCGFCRERGHNRSVCPHRNQLPSDLPAVRTETNRSKLVLPEVASRDDIIAAQRTEIQNLKLAVKTLAAQAEIRPMAELERDLILAKERSRKLKTALDAPVDKRLAAAKRRISVLEQLLEDKNEQIEAFVTGDIDPVLRAAHDRIAQLEQMISEQPNIEFLRHRIQLLEADIETNRKLAINSAKAVKRQRRRALTRQQRRLARSSSK